MGYKNLDSSPFCSILKMYVERYKGSEQQAPSK